MNETTEAAAAPATSTRAKRRMKRAPKPAAKKAPSKATPKKTASPKVSPAGRSASKKAKVLDMLRAEGGATLDELMAATGWQRHSCRGFLSTASKTVKIVSEKTDAGRRYRIAK